MELDIGGLTATVEKEMVNVPTRRIQSLAVHIHVPHKLSERDVKISEAAAYTCPVHKCMHPDVQMPIRFTWG